MSTIHACCLLLALSPSFVSGFMPSALSSQTRFRGTTSYHPGLRPQAPATMAFSLPGFGSKKQAPKKPTGENLYRQLGVPETAGYDDIIAAYDMAVANNAGDIKAVRKLEVLKDRIMEDRLAQRMSGALSGAVSRFDSVDKKKKLEVPDWMGGLVQLPDKPMMQRSGLWLGIMTAMGVSAPGMATTCLALSFLFSAGFLYNRGLPEPVKDDMGQIGEVRPVKMNVVGLTIGILTLAWLLGFLFSQAWVMVLPLPPVFTQESWVTTSCLFFSWMAVNLFRVQPRDDEL